jgi:outer membrane protein assembly factor BamB
LGADGTVYIGSDAGTLVALQGKTGRLLWTFTAAGEIRGAPAIGTDGTVYVSVVGPAEAHTQTYAIDGRTGVPKWDQTLPSNFATSVALGMDGTVFVVGHELPGSLVIDLSKLRPVLWALDGPTGTVKWMRFLEPGAEGVSAPSLGGDGTVYVHAEKPITTNGLGLLTALDPSTGLVKWEFTTGGSSNSSPTIGGDGTIYVGSDDGKVYAIR